MTLHKLVPSDVDPDSLVDLVHDCREVAGVLSTSVADLSLLPSARPPAYLRAMVPVQISNETAHSVDGLDDY